MRISVTFALLAAFAISLNSVSANSQTFLGNERNLDATTNTTTTNETTGNTTYVQPYNNATCKDQDAYWNGTRCIKFPEDDDTKSYNETKSNDTMRNGSEGNNTSDSKNQSKSDNKKPKKPKKPSSMIWSAANVTDLITTVQQPLL